MNNHDILKELNKRVYGHDKAKKVLINLVNRSKLRCSQMWDDKLPESDLIPTNNCLLVGKSGTGKTFLVESISAVMGFPAVYVDATMLMPTSASGGINVKDLIKLVRENAKAVMSQQPNKYYHEDEVIDSTIVFVDELDKLAQEFSSGNWNRHVQTSFLSLFENHQDLGSVSWIFAGAFTNLKREKENKKSIGFNHAETKEDDELDIESEITKFGIVPELMGRIHSVVELDTLTLDDYEMILRDKLLPAREKQLSMLNISPKVLAKIDIKAIAKRAFRSTQGVRFLNKELDKLFVDIEFDAEPIQSLPFDVPEEDPFDEIFGDVDDVKE